MKKVGIIGHFGFGHDLLNGQTIKTKIVSNEIEKRVGHEEIVRIDTRGGLLTLIRLPILLLCALGSFRNVIVMPAQNGLRIIAPLLVLFNFLFRRKIHYVVVGGWLPEFLLNKGLLTKLLKYFSGIYVETKTMKSCLNSMGFGNVVVMPNFKDLKILNESELSKEKKEAFRFCTFSRVMKEKGIEDAVAAIKIVNGRFGKKVCSLDIFGQIDENQIVWFDKLKSEFPEYIQYRGMIPFDKSVDVLREYDILLFPTFYKGEGFPGTLIDAFAAGVPVIASDWHYNKELVENGADGFIVPVKKVNELAMKIEWCVNNQELIYQMKRNCLEKAQIFSPDQAIKPLMAMLG